MWNAEALLPETYPNREDVHEVFVRALLMDSLPLDEDHGRIPKEDFWRYKEAYTKYVQTGTADESGDNDELSEEDRFAFGIASQIHMLVWNANGWQFCSTASGYLGWAPTDAIIGDSLYVVYGSRVPFVLRPCDTTPSVSSVEGGHFFMIGTAFVHGFMNGELTREHNMAGRTEEVISVH
jgi:hypothetical protein